MKKALIIPIFSLVALFACEDENLINGANTSNNSTTETNTGTTKCYPREVLTVRDGQEYIDELTYNTKNIIEKTIEDDRRITIYEYDGEGRISKQIITEEESTETYTYSYDSKNNISNIKYSTENTPFNLLINEYVITNNSSGQITAVEAITEDGNLNFSIEYDTQNNIKKIALFYDGIKQTLIENVKFDGKPNAFINTGLDKIKIPLIISGAFFGQNLTYFMNKNNILSDKVASIFSDEPSTTTYKYEYSKEGLPSKINFLLVENNENYSGTQTFTYNCK